LARPLTPAQGMTVHLRNIFGGGETLEGNVSAGTQTRRAFAATLAAPLVRVDPSVRTHGALALSGVRRDNSSFASASEDAHMLRASVRVRSVRARTRRPGLTRECPCRPRRSVVARTRLRTTRRYGSSQTSRPRRRTGATHLLSSVRCRR
jgi:hypothetical protein